MADFQYILDQALEPSRRESDHSRSSDGGLKLNTRDGGFGFTFAEIMRDAGGTVIWDKSKKDTGTEMYHNIWEYLAGEFLVKRNVPVSRGLFVRQPTIREKMEAAQEYSAEVRTGYTTFRSFCSAKGFAIYRFDVGNKTVITLDGDLIVDEICARDAFIDRRKVLVKGQQKAFIKEASMALRDPEQAKRLLTEETTQLIS